MSIKSAAHLGISGRLRKGTRIAYLSGPIDAVKVFQEWSEGRQIDFFGTIYLKQFYSVCSDLNAEGYVITTTSDAQKLTRVENFLIDNRPLPSRPSGVLYHLAMLVWTVRLLPGLFRFRPDVLILTAAANHWFLLTALRLIGVTFIPALHCALWPKFGPVRLSWRILMTLNRVFIFKYVKGAMAVSDDAAAQLRSVAKTEKLKVSIFNATYPRSQFATIPPPALKLIPPFRLFFAGRIETKKGVYDLLDVAALLEKTRKGEFYFDVCGDGPELSALRDRAEELGLNERFNCHGWCDSQQMTNLLGKSHCVIIPTTTSFEEGFPKVFAEAILAGRPVVTSAICISKRSVGPAAIEVPPDNVGAYCRAVQQICDDHILYDQKRNACMAIQEQFYDQNKSWGAQLRQVLRAHYGT